MKVAHLDTGRSWRGGQGQVLLLMKGLSTRGHETLLLAPAGPLLEATRAAGLAAERWESHGEWDLGALWSAAGRLGRAAPAVVHCHTAHAHALGVPAARRARVPGVVVSRRVDFEVGRHALSWLKYRMPVDRYLCISRGVIEVMAAAGVPARKLSLVPSGIELAGGEATSPDRVPDLRARLGLPPEAVVIGTVAALAPHKDHATLLEAAALVIRARPGTHFVWLGEGECRLALERRRAELGLEASVHLPGFLPEARALIPQFTLFALSSHLEGLCTSLLDAQALGVAIVATAVGGIPEVVEDGVTGRLAPPHDPGALAALLIEALDHPGRRAGWAARARETVVRFGIDHTVERTLEEYRAVLREHGVPA